MSVFHEVFHNSIYHPDEGRRRLFYSIKDSKDYVQRLGLFNCLKVHKGCVNTLCWNDKGQYLLSGSDDQSIVITNPFDHKALVQYKTAHRANIFSARFMPQSNDRGIVSCSGDGVVLYTELTSIGGPNPRNKSALHYFNCHNSGTTYEVMTVPTEPHSFMSCGEDGTVRLFDLRQMSSCHKTCCKDNILIFSPSAITAMSLSPISQYYIAVGSSDSLIRIYDRRYLSYIDFSPVSTPSNNHTIPVKAFTIPSHVKRTYRVTSIQHSADETELLVSYSSDYLYLIDITKEGVDSHALRNQKTDRRTFLDSPPPVRKLRLRGDWSDTGPDARPERDVNGRVEIGQVRPQLQGTIMHRMTEVLSRMLADPRTRVGLSSQGNEITQDAAIFDHAAQEFENFAQTYEPQPSTSGSCTNSQGSKKKPTESTDDDDDDDDDEVEADSKRKQANKDKKARSLKKEGNKVDIDDLSMFNYKKMKFVGHRNARTMIKEATFWGHNYVMSGSDCGHVFVWDRFTGEIVTLLQADQHVVNCLQPHPTLPYLATSGIDYDIKLFAPVLPKSGFDKEKAISLMERNAIMLEETKDTITVPAAFMIRMLACIHALRNRRSSTTASSGNDTNTGEGSGNQSNDNRSRSS